MKENYTVDKNELMKQMLEKAKSCDGIVEFKALCPVDETVNPIVSFTSTEANEFTVCRFFAIMFTAMASLQNKFPGEFEIGRQMFIEGDNKTFEHEIDN